MRTKTKKRKPQVTRADLHKLCAEMLSAESLDACCGIIESFRAKRSIRKRGAWYRAFSKLIDACATKRPRFEIFRKGNSKLPFWSFSTLPQYTCPGAGNCLEYCYSFTAWRYPAAFCRQAQNTLFLKHNVRAISESFLSLRDSAIVRLYVDGDFSNHSDLTLWFTLLNIRRDIRAYGYSKSLHLFAEWSARGLPFPDNYRLNISSGSRFDGLPIVRQIERLPITRGRFICVPVHGNYAKGFARFANSQYHEEVRQAAREVTGKKRVFSCPGKCAACLSNGKHACADSRFDTITIAIGEH